MVDLDLNDLWIDVMGFSKRDWQELEVLAMFLEKEGHFPKYPERCLVLALAIWVDGGRGLHEADH